MKKIGLILIGVMLSLGIFAQVNQIDMSVMRARHAVDTLVQNDVYLDSRIDSTSFIDVTDSTATLTTLTVDSIRTGAIVYTDTYFDDLRVPLTNTRINPLLSEPTFEDAGNGIWAFGFDADADSTETLNFIAQMPHGWAGNDVDAHIHWMTSTTNTGDVLWKMKVQVAAINGDWAVIDSFYVTDAGSGTAYQHQYLDMGDIPADSLGSGVSAIIAGSLARVGGDAADTYTGSAYGLEVDFHYEISSPGSEEETIKY